MADFFSMMEKLQGMLDSDDVEIVTNDGRRVRGKIGLRNGTTWRRIGTAHDRKQIMNTAVGGESHFAHGPVGADDV